MMRLVAWVVAGVVLLSAAPACAETPADYCLEEVVPGEEPPRDDSFPDSKPMVVDGLALEIISKFDERVVLRDSATGWTGRAKSPFGEAEFYPSYYDAVTRRVYGGGPGGADATGWIEVWRDADGWHLGGSGTLRPALFETGGFLPTLPAEATYSPLLRRSFYSGVRPPSWLSRYLARQFGYAPLATGGSIDWRSYEIDGHGQRLLPMTGHHQLRYVGDDPVARRAVFADGLRSPSWSRQEQLYLYDGTTLSLAPSDGEGPYVRWRSDPLTGQDFLKDRSNALYRYDGNALLRLGTLRRASAVGDASS